MHFREDWYTIYSNRTVTNAQIEQSVIQLFYTVLLEYIDLLLTSKDLCYDTRILLALCLMLSGSKLFDWYNQWVPNHDSSQIKVIRYIVILYLISYQKRTKCNLVQ